MPMTALAPQALVYGSRLTSDAVGMIFALSLSLSLSLLALPLSSLLTLSPALSLYPLRPGPGPSAARGLRPNLGPRLALASRKEAAS